MNSILSKNNICAIIPFFNEEDRIKETIEKTLAFVDLIIAVDDGSTDNSLKNIPSSNFVKILSHKTNLGKGAALNTGFKESIRLGFEYAVTLDSDLQHDPDFIPAFVKKIIQADIAIGNRLNDTSSMPVHRIFSNKITSFLLSKKIGQKIYDSQCGFRIYRTKILHDILPASPGFEAETEILINAARKNYTIAFLPISTIYSGEQSRMKSWKTISGFIRLMLS